MYIFQSEGTTIVRSMKVRIIRKFSCLSNFLAKHLKSCIRFIEGVVSRQPKPKLQQYPCIRRVRAVRKSNVWRPNIYLLKSFTKLFYTNIIRPANWRYTIVTIWTMHHTIPIVKISLKFVSFQVPLRRLIRILHETISCPILTFGHRSQPKQRRADDRPGQLFHSLLGVRVLRTHLLLRLVSPIYA